MVRVTAVATLTAFSAGTFTANGTAAVINPALAPVAVSQPQQVAERTTSPRRTAPEPAETYQERQDRIAQSPRSLLTPLQENQDQPTVCVSGEFTTLRVVYDSMFESLLPSLPPQLRQNAYTAREQAHRDMARTHLSTLAISDNPMALGASADDSPSRYRGPVSQLIISDLLKIRDGREDEAIALENITLTQAIETVWLYLFVTVISPARIMSGLLPEFGSPLTSTPLSALASFVTYKSLLRLTITGGALGLQMLYQAIANSMINQCVARVTEDQRAAAGRPSENVHFDIDIPRAVRDTANQLALADDETCPQIGLVPLSRIVQRSSQNAQANATTSGQKQRIKNEERRLLAQMRGTRVPHNLIPADPADFNQVESLISLLGTISPLPIGAPLDIAIGLSHNRNQGDNFGETVSVADLTVTKTLTAAYYSYYLTLWFYQIGALGVGTIAGNAVLSWVLGVTGGLAALPLTYGLVNYHNVIRSMCFVEDDTTGTGRGGQVNRDRAVLPSVSTTTPTPTTRHRRQANPSTSRSASPRRSAAATTTTTTPVIPGLPVRIPGIN
ncbi:MAG: hypothetical protein QM662_02990 [Gordonia sp. (in: high G+C Gram-positive bacteria)]